MNEYMSRDTAQNHQVTWCHNLMTDRRHRCHYAGLGATDLIDDIILAQHMVSRIDYVNSHCQVIVLVLNRSVAPQTIAFFGKANCSKGVLDPFWSPLELATSI